MAKTKSYSLISDYLNELGVPFTIGYSEKRFNEMPFQTLFGFSKLLSEYNITSEAYEFKDKSSLKTLTPPFIAVLPAGEVVVTQIGNDKVSYLSEGEKEEVDINKFTEAWTGKVMLSFPTEESIEPGYKLHARIEWFMSAKKWILAACALFLFFYFFITRRLYENLSTIFISAIDIAGLYITYLLVQKSVKIKNPAADRVCGVLQAGGCDSILEMKASKFFGIFGWSEVGFAYFSVSLITLLLFPDMIKWLALCNVCCLPFTVWSIWYQRFKAHKWCTLCVCVQCSLWLLFFCYAFGGWLTGLWPLKIELFVLGAAYLGVMLGLNALMPLIEKNNESN
ncbi:MAG: hypothetical protein HDS87_07815 [Bacteroidales bacterium]|nr:hypothetical protein [Bacteroidales bacterium]